MRHYLLCACVLMAACATGGTVQRPLARAELPSYDRRQLVLGDENRRDAGSAYDLIRRLRPEYLMSRGPTSILLNVSETPEVYIDGMRRGGLEELQSLPASEVLDVHFYPVSSVPVSLTGNHPAGVIAVRTRSR
jgi:hypothetical protein